MKKLQIMIEDELFTALKIAAFKNGTSMKDLVTAAINAYMGEPQKQMATPTAPIPEWPAEDKKTKAKIEPPAPKRYTAPEPEPDYSKTLDELLNEEPDPTDERYYYVLRKTFMTTLYEDEDKWYSNGTLRWLVPKDCQAHYDRDNNLIPFRYTMPDSYTIKQPTAAEIKQIEKAYGKPVKIEE